MIDGDAYYSLELEALESKIESDFKKITLLHEEERLKNQPQVIRTALENKYAANSHMISLRLFSDQRTYYAEVNEHGKILSLKPQDPMPIIFKTEDFDFFLLPEQPDNIEKLYKLIGNKIQMPDMDMQPIVLFSLDELTSKAYSYKSGISGIATNPKAYDHVKEIGSKLAIPPANSTITDEVIDRAKESKEKYRIFPVIFDIMSGKRKFEFTVNEFGYVLGCKPESKSPINFNTKGFDFFLFPNNPSGSIQAGISLTKGIEFEENPSTPMLLLTKNELFKSSYETAGLKGILAQYRDYVSHMRPKTPLRGEGAGIIQGTNLNRETNYGV